MWSLKMGYLFCFEKQGKLPQKLQLEIKKVLKKKSQGMPTHCIHSLPFQTPRCPL
jgi:hypothetical protein